MEQVIELLVPNIGDFKNVPIIELLVKVGDTLNADTGVVTLESDKANMEVPAEVEGVVTEILVQEGDTVSEGSLLLRYSQVGSAAKKTASPEPPLIESIPAGAAKEENTFAIPPVTPGVQPATSKVQPGLAPVRVGQTVAASPSVRQLARQLGVDLMEVVGSGRKGRLQKQDIEAHVKRTLQNCGGQRVMPEEPQIDFSVFGEVESQPLGRIQKISGAQLARNWAAIPHVTSFDEADITSIDAFRRGLNQSQQIKLTLLPFMIKAAQYTLKSFPHFNSSLQGDQLIIKKYFHIGFAVDTPNGLLVPVIRDVNQKGLLQLASEASLLANLARAGKLKPSQMQGGTFTISSLGSIGGTHFTPIINAPEVAILALGRTSMKPVWDGSQFLPRLTLPLSLSWDHRVVDGVTASRFNREFCRLLEDFRRALL